MGEGGGGGGGWQNGGKTVCGDLQTSDFGNVLKLLPAQMIGSM